MAAESGNRLRHTEQVERIRRAILEVPGVTDRSLRQKAHDGAPLPPPLGPYLQKIRDAAWSVTDSDIDQLKSAGYSEDAILELTVAVAVAAAGQRHLALTRLVRGG
jgi:hypothetical protein